MDTKNKKPEKLSKMQKNGLEQEYESVLEQKMTMVYIDSTNLETVAISGAFLGILFLIFYISTIYYFYRAREFREFIREKKLEKQCAEYIKNKRIMSL